VQRVACHESVVLQAPARLQPHALGRVAVRHEKAVVGVLVLRFRDLCHLLAEHRHRLKHLRLRPELQRLCQLQVHYVHLQRDQAAAVARLCEAERAGFDEG